MYEIPRRSKMVNYCDDTDNPQNISYYRTFGDNKPQVLLCSNCELPKIECVYWEHSGTKQNPFTGYQRVMETVNPEQLG
jgi:hypothetical protein